MPISDICNTKVVSVEKDDSILKVARLMRERHVGCVVVTQPAKGKRIPTGIITDRDLVLEVMAAEADPNQLSAGDIVVHSPIVAEENDGIRETLHRMRSHGIRRVPVIDGNGFLAGIVSADDMIEFFAKEFKDLAKMIAIEQRHEKEKLSMGFAAAPGFGP